jgi:hypothetical protein
MTIFEGYASPHEADQGSFLSHIDLLLSNSYRKNFIDLDETVWAVGLNITIVNIYSLN